MEKLRRRLLLIILVFGVAVLPAMADRVIFSANFNGTLNAQVVPQTNRASNPVPQFVDSDGDSGLTQGSQGFGGFGEALLICDYADLLDYKVDVVDDGSDPLAAAAWFPRNGRVRMKVNLKQLIPGTTAQLFAFQYSPNKSYEVFSVELGYLGHSSFPGGWVSIRGRDATMPNAEDNSLNTYNNSTDPDLPAEIPGMAGNVIGWHDIVVEWTEVAAHELFVQQEIIDVKVYVDGKLGLRVPNCKIGAPMYLDEISFASWVNLPPLGNYGGSLIDEFVVEEITAPSSCGEGNTFYAKADISGPDGIADCYIDLFDFAQMASAWMDCTDPISDNCSN